MKLYFKYLDLEQIILSEILRPRKTNMTCSISPVLPNSELSDIAITPHQINLSL